MQRAVRCVYRHHDLSADALGPGSPARVDNCFLGFLTSTLRTSKQALLFNKLSAGDSEMDSSSTSRSNKKSFSGIGFLISLGAGSGTLNRPLARLLLKHSLT